MKDTAQLAIFISWSHCCPQVYEGVSSSFVQLPRHHHWARHLGPVLQCVQKQHSLDLSVSCAWPDRRCPAMTGKEEGCASLLVRHCEAADRTNPAHPQGALHHPPRVPVLQVANLTMSLSVVVKVRKLPPLPQLNHRSSRTLNGRKFNAHYGDLALTSVRAPLVESWSHMLSARATCKQEIATFPSKRTSPVLIIVPNRNGLPSGTAPQIHYAPNDLNVKLLGKKF
ncbi:hypothetical protein GWK47_054011 [Chionoecetes opilio]|uniref:Uncharacterized protein n=1 Tax=Chionoecetes opilio TaxID=41210 RepID=A0A8J4XZ55_CHIOP|nr:hypothetical protein GWK47_054011 [Chionoecetes opilio]